MSKRQDAKKMISDLISMETNNKIKVAYDAARAFAWDGDYRSAALIMNALGHPYIADMLWEG